MNNKFYISLEAAKLLKELGYNNYSIVYDCSVKGSILLNQQPIYGEWVEDKDVYPCPTKAEVIDWLESKGIVVEVMLDCNMQRWYFSIYKEEKTPWIKHLSADTFQTRLEAEEAVIIEALKLLHLNKKIES